MRNLTITRRKSFVGCLMADHVYIRDTVAPEITIDGEPCRKIGTLKNGETKTFPIEDSQQQIFLIADKLSKDYCNATITVSAGLEDVVLSGVHVPQYGSNPFCFDGVLPTAEQQAKQKRNRTKGIIITVVASILGAILGFFLTQGLLALTADTPKTYVKEDFQITLTDDFEAGELEGFYAFYQTKAVMVFTVREDASLVGDIPVEEYAELVLEANNRTNTQLTRHSSYVWFDYNDTPNDQEIYYFVVCCKSDSAYWIVNFATPATNREQYQDRFLEWAETIEVD